MKTRKQPPAKLPKGRVIQPWAGSICGFYCAKLPAATKAQARQMVKALKFLAKAEGEQRFALACIFAAADMGIDTLSPAEFRVMRPAKIISACKRADQVLATLYGEAKP